MLIGMALFKLGFFSAKRSNRFYAIFGALGLAIGLGLAIAGVQQNEARDWAFEYSFFFGVQFNYWGSPFVSIGYASLIMLACRQQWLASLQTRLAAVGRMALSNYLMQTILCTTLFYGHGFGWYESLSRPQLLAVVATIWIAQLLISPWWLDKFRFGPFEWLWRSLSYWKWQSLTTAPATQPSSDGSGEPR